MMRAASRDTIKECLFPSERLSLACSGHGLKKMTAGGLLQERPEGHRLIRVSLKAEEQASEDNSLRKGWSKYNDYMKCQMDLILNTDWANEFKKQALVFGKVDAAYLIRKSFGDLCPVA